MSRYTPGPWFFEGSVGIVAHPQEGDDADIEDPQGRYVFVLDPKTIGETTCVANLELAAAAPELLEACKDLLDCEEDTISCDICLDKLKAAIKKAEGSK